MSYMLHLTSINGSIHAAARDDEGRTTPVLLAPIGRNAEARLQALIHALPFAVHGRCTGVVLPCYRDDAFTLDLRSACVDEVPSDRNTHRNDLARYALRRDALLRLAVHTAAFWHVGITRFPVTDWPEATDSGLHPAFQLAKHIEREIEAYDLAASRRFDVVELDSEDMRLQRWADRALPRQFRGMFDAYSAEGWHDIGLQLQINDGSRIEGKGEVVTLADLRKRRPVLVEGFANE